MYWREEVKKCTEGTIGSHMHLLRLADLFKFHVDGRLLPHYTHLPNVRQGLLIANAVALRIDVEQ